jgi:histidyl-tRNA synthetase
MASPVNAPRGMRDFLPADKATRERVLGVIRDTYRSHGFDEIETPVMEDSARLHAGLGGDNEKLAFGVLKRGLTVDDLRTADDALELADLGLRFDLTVPLARFYATHRAELPKVFRSIQIAPVWRAERPQKGRYRQFVQCDIDIIGEPGPLAEVELISATAATVRALGIDGCRIIINDRRLLTSMLTVLGFPASAHAAVLITVDKLDKLGVDGVISELKDRVFPAEPVAALAEFLRRPKASDGSGSPAFGESTIRASLPDGVDESVIAELAALGTMLGADDRAVLTFDPFLVRGMGYYTGTIFEVTHPEFGYSLGGGGRYDGMIGRFLGTDVAAAGFSLGFERLVDLVDLPDTATADAAALLYDDRTDAARLMELKSELVATGARVRLERSTKNTRLLLDSLVAQGFRRVATVRPETTTVADLEWRELG